jgi:hypothetical protein
MLSNGFHGGDPIRRGFGQPAASEDLERFGEFASCQGGAEKWSTPPPNVRMGGGSSSDVKACRVVADGDGGSNLPRLVSQSESELAACGDVEFSEYLAQVVRDRVGADKQLRADLSVGGPASSQRGDLRLPRS